LNGLEDTKKPESIGQREGKDIDEFETSLREYVF
jgi:hypothetical protein